MTEASSNEEPQVTEASPTFNDIYFEELNTNEEDGVFKIPSLNELITGRMKKLMKEQEVLASQQKELLPRIEGFEGKL